MESDRNRARGSVVRRYLSVGMKFVRLGNVRLACCVVMMNRVDHDFMCQPNPIFDGIRNMSDFPDRQVIQAGIRIGAKGDLCIAFERERCNGSGSMITHYTCLRWLWNDSSRRGVIRSHPGGCAEGKHKKTQGNPDQF